MFYDINNNRLMLNEQNFSFTDLCTSKDKLGVVFPYDADEDITQSYCVSSIIDHHNSSTGHWIKHTEVRDVKKENGKLVYSKLTFATAYTIMSKAISESIENTFTHISNKDYTEYYSLNPENTSIVIKKNIYEKFQPLFFIDEKNIKSKSYTTIGRYWDLLDDGCYDSSALIPKNTLKKDINNEYLDY